MTLLVTGAAGFIGSHVCRHLLARGDRVIGIDSLDAYYTVQLKRDRLAQIAAGPGGGRFTFAQVDFSDETALEAAIAGEAVERIVHLGAQAGVRYSLENPRAYVRSNLVGHVNLLELARHSRVAHLV